jgi:tripartite-type tricarboxylate transporter receptor subunit TctC
MMKLKKLLFLAMALAPSLAPAQSAADYPTKLVRIIVPFPPGGAPTTFTRLVADQLAARWKQSVIVENRPGAGGNVGAALVARAEPDGYTLLSSPPGPIAINGSLYKSLQYDPAKWSPVTILTRQPMILAARKGLPADSVQELIALAKANPGKLSFGSPGNGSISHLTMTLFLAMGGVKLLHVPYQGSPPALTALMADDQIDIFFENPILLTGPSRSGRIKILAGGSTQRLPMLPNVQTFSEAGFSKLQPYAWLGVVAPPNTPAAITEKISRAMADALGDADLRSKLAEFVTEPVGNTPPEMAAFVAMETATWREVIQAANVTLD